MSSPSNQNGRNLDPIQDKNKIAGILAVHRIDCADASGNNDIVLDGKFHIVSAHMRATGGAAHATADTWQLFNGANAVTEAVAKTATVNAVSKATTINPANEEVAAGATLRVTTAKNTNAAGTVIVIGFIVP